MAVNAKPSCGKTPYTRDHGGRAAAAIINRVHGTVANCRRVANGRRVAERSVDDAAAADVG